MKRCIYLQKWQGKHVDRDALCISCLWRACYSHKSSRICPLAEGAVNRAWSVSLLPASLRELSFARAEHAGTAKEGERIYPAQRAAFRRAGTSRVARDFVSHLGKRRQHTGPGRRTGLAHMFEHMAFKGTETIGTRNWPEEKKALDAVEEAYDRMEAEANKGVKADQMRVDMLRNQFRLAADNATRLSASGEYRQSLKKTAPRM